MPAGAAQVDPVASVAVLLEVPHLDRTFDYWVPEKYSQLAQPGVRVRVRFAGRLVDGFLLERRSVSEYSGDLAPLRAVIDARPVLTREILALVRAVAARYAGTFTDVVRAAVPPRHRQAELRVLAASRDDPAPTGPAPAGPVPGAKVGVGAQVPAGWASYEGAAGFIAAAAQGRAPRAVWVSGPGESPVDRVRELAAAQGAAGRGVIVVVPDAADLARFSTAFRAGGLQFEALSAAAGPQARYSSFLRILTGQRRLVIGTRGAVFAPVADLGLLVVWDDLDDSHWEPHAPGWHTREVAALRSAIQGAALVIAGSSVSVESANLLARGWAGALVMPRARIREVAAAVAALGEPRAGEHAARLPPAVVGQIRQALADGPVVLSVRRTGYLPALSCQRCRELAACPRCGLGLLATQQDTSTGSPVAGRCPEHGPLPQWSCLACGGTRLRAAAVGAARTVEEIGRAFPGAQVVGSWAGARVEQLATGTARASGLSTLVVATPGCEPDPGPLGYRLAVLLDGAAALSRPGLRTGEDVLARWLALASRVRPASAGGRVLLSAPAGAREAQALIRWDPLGYARRELEDRITVGLPPAVRAVSFTGSPAAAADAVAAVRALLRAAAQVRGPIPVPDDHPVLSHARADAGTRLAGQVRWLVSVPVSQGAELADAVKQVQSTRSAAREPVVTHRMDPRTLI